MNLIGIHEIAQSLGVTRTRADQLSRQRDFPKPLAELKMGRVWRLSDFEKWKERHGR